MTGALASPALGMTAMQVGPVERLDPGDAGNVFGMAGIGVAIDGDRYRISITDATGLSLQVRLDDAKLSEFGHRLAFAIEERNAIELAPDRSIGAAGEREARRIVVAVARRTGFGLHQIIGPSREARIVRVRKAAIWAVRTCTVCSFPDIGRIFGDRDHTTALDQFNRANDLRDSDAEFREFTDALRAAIEGDGWQAA